MKSIRLQNIGQIKNADISFGDLTILVGPQATGKSIFLQLLKLVNDSKQIQTTLREYGSAWRNEFKSFLGFYLGEGMQDIWTNRSSIKVNDQSWDFQTYRGTNNGSKVSTFIIPAQRTLAFRMGWPLPYSDFGPDVPFNLKYFSDAMRRFLQSGYGIEGPVYPRLVNFHKEISSLVHSELLGRYDLNISQKNLQNERLVLQNFTNSTSLPYGVWSAGQREFVPLIVALSWLCPENESEQNKQPRRDNIKWVIIEEPEMGLHPKAISLFMIMVMELLSRNYKVVVSTHSTHVLDIVWGMRVLTDYKGATKDLSEMLEAPTDQYTQQMLSSSLKKKSKVYYFSRGGSATDISALDPGSENEKEAGWGGLNEFSGRVNDVVARVVSARQKG